MQLLMYLYQVEFYLHAMCDMHSKLITMGIMLSVICLKF